MVDVVLLRKQDAGYSDAINYIMNNSLNPTVSEKLCQGLVSGGYVRYSLGKEPDVVIVAVDNNTKKLGGFALVFGFPKKRTKSVPDALYIDIICALPSAKGAGVMMINELKRFAIDSGIDVIALKALSRVITYYASKHGFVNSEDHDDKLNGGVCMGLDVQKKYYNDHTPNPTDVASINNYIDYLLDNNMIDKQCLSKTGLKKRECATENGFPMVWCSPNGGTAMNVSPVKPKSTIKIPRNITARTSRKPIITIPQTKSLIRRSSRVKRSKTRVKSKKQFAGRFNGVKRRTSRKPVKSPSKRPSRRGSRK